jgi:hypothetical protein
MVSVALGGVFFGGRPVGNRDGSLFAKFGGGRERAGYFQSLVGRGAGGELSAFA